MGTDGECDWGERGYLWYFIPGFDELALFLMAVAFLVLYFTETTLRAEAYEMLLCRFSVWGLLTLVLFVVGLVFSIYHVFATREKTDPEKWTMLFFAVVVNYSAGLAAGIHILRESHGWVVVFPVWNVICGVVLVLMGGFNVIDETYIPDEDARIAEVLVGLPFLVVIMVGCQHVFDLYWAVTFSICVAYVTSLSRAVQGLSRMVFRRGSVSE